MYRASKLFISDYLYAEVPVLEHALKEAAEVRLFPLLSKDETEFLCFHLSRQYGWV